MNHDNLNALRTGSLAIASQGANEIIYASSSTQFARSSLFTFNGTILTVGGLGVHAFSAGGAGANTVRVSNTTAGTGNYAEVSALRDGTVGLFLRAFSSTYTTSSHNVQAGAGVESDGSGGLSLAASHASGALRLYAGGTTLRGSFTTNGEYLVGSITATVLAGLVVLDYNANNFNGLTINDNATTSGATFAQFAIAGTAIGSITRVGATSAVAYNTTSDERLKLDQGLATDLGVLRALRVHEFVWRSDGSPGRGLFAQETYAVTRRGVTPGSESDLSRPWQMDYLAFLPDLIAGWQEHDARLKRLEAGTR